MVLIGIDSVQVRSSTGRIKMATLILGWPCFFRLEINVIKKVKIFIHCTKLKDFSMSIINNIVGFVKKSAYAKLGKSDTYNMMVETKDSGEHGFSFILKPMPGYKEVAKITGKPQGMYRCSRSYDGKPAVYGVWGKKLYLIDKGVEPVFIGDIGGSGNVTFCETSGYGRNHVHLVICDNVAIYCVDTEIDPPKQREYFSKHSPIQLPYCYPDSKERRVTPSWIAYLYGYLVMGAEGTDIFYVSRQYPFEDEDEKRKYDIFALSDTDYDKNGKHTGFGYGKFFFSEWQPDNTITGCSSGSRFFTLGERSFQVFSYQSSKEIPFASPDTASQSIGIRGKDTLAMYGSSIFWMGSADMGGNSIYTMGNDASPQKISTDEIEDMISGYDKDSAKSFCMRIGSHPMYVITFPVDDMTLAYDIRENGWIRLGSSDNKGHEKCYRYCNSVYSRNDKVWLQGDGVLVEATDDDWREHDGTPITRKRVGGVTSSEHKPFKVNKVSVLTNNGDYKNYVNKGARIMMRYSKDGSTFEDLYTKSLGRAGQYGYDVTFRNLGKSTEFIIELASSDNIPFALYGIDLEAIKTTK